MVEAHHHRARSLQVLTKMVYFPPSFIALAASLFFSAPAVAHPGHDIAEEIAERAAYLASDSYTGLAHCAETLKSRQAGLISRRKAMVQQLRTKRGIVKRDFEEVLNTDHHSNASVTPDSPDDIVFAGNASCILQPETTEGPYCKLYHRRPLSYMVDILCRGLWRVCPSRHH